MDVLQQTDCALGYEARLERGDARFEGVTCCRPWYTAQATISVRAVVDALPWRQGRGHGGGHGGRNGGQ